MTAASAQQALVTKILRAAADAGYVQKSDRNQQQGYAYAGDEAITEKFRTAMLAQGVLVYPRAPITVHDVHTIARSGKDVPNVLVTLIGDFVATDGAAEIVVGAVGQGIDIGDKAVPKALTGMKKYAYRMLVMMVTGDDPEIARADEAAESKPATQQRQQAAARPVGDTGQSQPDRPATDPQKRMLRALARENNLTDEELGAIRLSETGKHSTKDFTNADIDKMKVAIEAAGAVKTAAGPGAVVTA